MATSIAPKGYIEFTVHNLGFESMDDAYSAIVDGKEEELFDPGVQDVPANDGTGRVYSFLTIGPLAECACDHLSRRTEEGKAFRNEYEKRIIDRMARLSKKTTNLKLALGGTGCLAGEFFLLTKLIDRLKNKYWTGTIHLRLIDPIYATNARPNEEVFETLRTKASNLKKIGIGGLILSFLGLGYANTQTDERKKKTISSVSAIGALASMSLIGGGFIGEGYIDHDAIRPLVISSQLKDQRAAKAVNELFNRLQPYLGYGIDLKVQLFGRVEDYISLCQRRPSQRSFVFGSADADDSGVLARFKEIGCQALYRTGKSIHVEKQNGRKVVECDCSELGQCQTLMYA